MYVQSNANTEFWKWKMVRRKQKENRQTKIYITNEFKLSLSSFYLSLFELDSFPIIKFLLIALWFSAVCVCLCLCVYSCICSVCLKCANICCCFICSLFYLVYPLASTERKKTRENTTVSLDCFLILLVLNWGYCAKKKNKNKYLHINFFEIL